MSRVLAALFCVSFVVACGGAPADVSSSASSASATFDAGNGASDAGTAPAVDAGPAMINVSGVLLAPDGTPVSSVPVVISGKQPVNTDSAGHFSFTGVEVPYNVTVVDTAAPAGIVYEGLTRADPVLTYFGYSPPSPHGATAAGQISGGHFPESTGTATFVGFASPETQTGTFTDSSGNYSLPINWAGGATSTGRIYALQVEMDSNYLPTGYSGFADTDLSISAGGSFSSENLGLLPVTSASVSGSMSSAPGYAITEKDLLLQFDGNSLVYFADHSSSPGFTYVTPVAPSIGVTLRATATHSGYGTSQIFHAAASPSASGISLSIPAAPEAILPANAAIGVTGSMDFSWNTFANGMHILEVAPTSGSGARIVVVTAASHAQLPDLSSYGLKLPSNTGYSWQVVGLAPFANIDALASQSVVEFYSGRYTGEIAFGASATRTFTTAQ